MLKRPNILFCIADDASHFGYNGFGYVRTPNINKLASKGVILENAFTPNPKCAPSRACVLTGLNTWQLKEGCNHCSYFPSNVEVYPDILEQAGYYVGFTGKGWGPGDYQRCGRKRNPAGTAFNDKVLIPPQDSRISTCDYTENFRHFLNENGDDKPFCFWYGCKEPHRPYNFGESNDFQTSIEDIEYIPSYLPNHNIVRQDLLDYAFEINWFDYHIGNMVKLLEEKGKLEDTFILITSDNGAPFPRIKGQMYEQDFHLPMVAYWKGKILSGKKLQALISFIDIAPTFLEIAGIDSNNMSGHSFLELLMGKETIRRDYVFFGREKHDVGRVDDLGYPVRCIRDDTWLYVHNYEPNRYPSGNPETEYTNCDLSPTKELIMKLAKDGNNQYLNICFGKKEKEELYNIVEDKECINNLAEQSEYASIKRHLSDVLNEYLQETNDPRYYGNGNVFDEYPLYTEKIIPHSWQSYKRGTFSPLGPKYQKVKKMNDKGE